MVKMKFAAMFAFVLVLAGMLSATLYVDSYTITPSTLRPGEEGAITFAVKNVVPTGSTTTSTLESVQVFFSNAEGMEFLSKSPFTIGTIDSGGSVLVSVPFKVLPAAKGGVITASFYISQKDKTDLKTINAIFNVVNAPILSISSDHQTVDSTDSINLTITNNGGKANKVTLKIDDSSNFSFIGTTQVYVGDVSNSTSVLVQLDSRTVDEGVNVMPFIISYQQEGGSTVNETKYLTIAVKKEKADVVFTQIEPIITSQDSVLKMKVKNNGRALEDLKVYLIDTSIKPKESNQVKLGNIGTGVEKEFSIKVFAETEPGINNALFRLVWVEDDVEKTEDVSIPLVVKSDADAAIFIDSKPSPLVSGGDHTLSVLVSNVGSYKIQNVEVSLADSPAFDIFNAQRSQYIGGLESDDFSTVQYKIRIKQVQPGDYPLTVNVRYKDQSGVWVEKNQIVQVAIRSPADALARNGFDLVGTIIVLAIVAAIFGAGYFTYKLRHGKDGKK